MKDILYITMSAFENTPNNKEQQPETQQEEQLEKKPFKVFQGETVLVKRSDGSIENDWMVSETPFPEEEFIKVYKKDPENPENTITKGVLRSDMESMNGSEIDFNQAEDLDSLMKLIEKQGTLAGSQQEYSAETLREIIGKVESGELESKMITRAGGLRDAFERVKNNSSEIEKEILIKQDYVENISKLNNYDSFDELKNEAENSPAIKKILENISSEIDKEFYEYVDTPTIDEISEENREEFKQHLERYIEADLRTIEKIRHLAYGKGTEMGKAGIPQKENFNTLYDFGREKIKDGIGYTQDPNADEEFRTFLQNNYYKIQFQILQEKFPFLKKQEKMESELLEVKKILPEEEYNKKRLDYRKDFNEFSFSEMVKSNKLSEFFSENSIINENSISNQVEDVELQEEKMNFDLAKEKISTKEVFEQEILNEKSPTDILNTYKEYLSYGDVNPEAYKYGLNEEGELEKESSGSRYSESLSNILDSDRAESLETVKETIRNYYEHIKQNLGLEDTVYGKSETWIYWDIAKQEYMVNNPESSKEEYLLADPLDFENSSESRELIQQIADRHIAWEICNPQNIDSFNKKGLSQRTINLIEKAKENPGSQALSSIEYSELGRLVREANSQENIFN